MITAGGEGTEEASLPEGVVRVLVMGDAGELDRFPVDDPPDVNTSDVERTATVPLGGLPSQPDDVVVRREDVYQLELEGAPAALHQLAEETEYGLVPDVLAGQPGPPG